VSIISKNLRLCWKYGSIRGNTVDQAKAGVYIQRLAFRMAGVDQSWEDLGCPTNFKKDPTVMARANGAPVALCIKVALAGTRVGNLLQDLSLRPNCTAANGTTVVRVPGNIRGPGQNATFVCATLIGSGSG
jgi:hypothetical protein